MPQSQPTTANHRQPPPTTASSASSLLTLNAGSSSMKFALFDQPDLTLRLTGELDGVGQQTRFDTSAIFWRAFNARMAAWGDATGSQWRLGMVNAIDQNAA